jgi:hypothetical protein
MACAGTLLAWGQRSLGLGLLRRGLDPAQDGAHRLPLHLVHELDDAASEHAALLRRAAEGVDRLAPWVGAGAALLRHGETAAAQAVTHAARRWVTSRPEPAGRFRAALTLARAVAESADQPLAGAVQTAVEEEVRRIVERLRVDDPPTTTESIRR